MIYINLLRISPDSQYIEFSVECPTNYIFNTLNIKKYDWETTTGYPDNALGWVDASALYQGSSTKEVMRIATSIFKGSTMFQLEFGVQWIGGETEPLNPDGSKLSDQTTIGVCSDINNIYEYLFTEMLNLYTSLITCVSISDDLKRAYIILYAHQNAMALGRIEDAEMFYDVLKNNFGTCSQVVRQNSGNSFSCNCN